MNKKLNWNKSSVNTIIVNIFLANWELIRGFGQKIRENFALYFIDKS